MDRRQVCLEATRAGQLAAENAIEAIRAQLVVADARVAIHRLVMPFSGPKAQLALAFLSFQRRPILIGCLSIRLTRAKKIVSTNTHFYSEI